MKLTFATCLAQSTETVTADIAAYLARRLPVTVDVAHDISWQERHAGIERGDIQLGWICGLPYVKLMDLVEPPVELLAAPVLAAPRYQDQPIYFSDVVVRRDSAFHNFADLRGARWAYNEPGSHSGYVITCYHLAQMGEDGGYFGQVTAAGGHVRALEMILAGAVDGAAIDSTVLETELARKPGLADQIRVVAVFGPSPIPPWVVSLKVPASLREGIREALLGMHGDSEGGTTLAKEGIARFERVSDADYDLIRAMRRVARAVRL